MALPLVKVGILVGAGLLGSCLAKEGRVSDMVSGVFKIAWKQIRDDKSNTPLSKKPSNDALMAQMDKIRRELQLYASSGPITIVTGRRTGASKYGLTVVVVVAGYGYLWWKGWRLPDMMFATKHSLADAGKAISKQIDAVFSSISVTKRQLSSKLDGMDHSLTESSEAMVSTQQQVLKIKASTDSISLDVGKVQDAVLTLETRINRIEGTQGSINFGVLKLCEHAKRLENSKTTERIQELPSNSSRRLELPPASPSSLVTPPRSSRPALELPSASSSRAGSLPLVLESEPRPLGSNGIRENNGISDVIEPSAPGSTSNGGSSSGRFGFKYPMVNTSTILRTRSATIGMLQQNRTASQKL